MKIVITGGLGFIGTHFARRMIDAGNEVRLIDNLSPQIHGQIPSSSVPDGAEFVRMDVCDLADRSDLLDGFDAVAHLAAETGTAQSMYRIADYVRVNELGTAALLEGLARCESRPRKILLSSSRSVYGEGAYRDSNGRIVQPGSRSRAVLDAREWEPTGKDGCPLDVIATPETLGYAPGSIYAATKASQELLMQSAAEALDISPIVLRFQNVYGEGQSLQNPYTGIISIFFNRARQGLELPIYEDGNEMRDFVHIDDVTAAMEGALIADLPPATILNVGSGIGTRVMDLAHELIAAGGFTVPVNVTGQFRIGDIRHNFADIAAAGEKIGFKPQVSLSEGLARFCAWAQGQPEYQDRLDQATKELRDKGLAN